MTGNNLCIEQGKRLLNAGDRGSARAKFEEALALDPGNKEALFELAKTHYMMGEYRAAKALFARLIRVKHSIVHSSVLMAKCCIRTDDYEVAYKLLGKFRKAGDLAPDVHTEIKELLNEINSCLKECCRQEAMAYYDTDPARAIAGFRRGMRYSGENVKLYRDCGKLYLKQKKYAQALQIFRKGLRQKDSGELRFWLGVGLRYIGKNGKALSELEKAWVLKADEGSICLEKGENYRLLGDCEKAKEAYLQGVAHSPRNAELHLGLGRLLAGDGENKQAIGEFRKGLKYAPDQWQFYFEIGKIYSKKGRYAEAIQEFNRALRYTPDHYDIHLELGFAYANLKRYDTACKEYHRAADEIERVCKSDCDGDDVYYENRTIAEYKAAIKYSPDDKAAHSGKDYYVNMRMNETDILRNLRCFSKPVGLYVRLTRRCNLKCVMCPTVRQEQATLPRQVFEKLWPLLPSIGSIQWIGGEVFLVDYFRDLLLKIHKEFPHISHNLTTNGLLINEDWAKVLCDLDVHVHFSIDSVVKETYERVRKGGSFKRLTHNLDLMNRLYSARYPGMKYVFSLKTIVMRSNLDELALFPEFCREFGIGNLGFRFLECHVSPDEILFETMDRGLIHSLRQRIRAIEKECHRNRIYFECYFGDLLKYEVPESRMKGSGTAKGSKCLIPWTNLYISNDGMIKADQEPGIGSGEMFRQQLDSIWKSVINARGGARWKRSSDTVNCIQPWLNLYIDSDGSVAPFSDCETRVGNILTDPIDDLWNGRRMQMYRRKLLDGRIKGWCAEDCVKGVRGRDNALLCKVESLMRCGLARCDKRERE